ncbi:MAG: hypothetical protein RLY59_1002 [Actinomycetota bacterium]|jgi:uncharacterized repeat protein (TIGR02543 family)
MKKFSLKALGAAILTLGLVVAGATLPANAANVTATIVTNPANTAFGASTGTPEFTVTVPGAAISSSLNYISVGASLSGTNWTPVNTCPAFGSATDNNLAACGITDIKIGGTSVTGWKAYTGGVTYTGIRIFKIGTALSTATADIEIYFSQNAFVTPATNGYYTFGVGTETGGGSAIDRGTTTVLVGTAPTSSVTFNANGGTGTMASQSSNTSAALNANTFTRAGYTFAGWNVLANGTGLSYADGATYNFQSNRTLYAQWTANGGNTPNNDPTLATTGVNAAPYLLGGLAFALTGGALMLIARRKQNN